MIFSKGAAQIKLGYFYLTLDIPMTHEELWGESMTMEKIV